MSADSINDEILRIKRELAAVYRNDLYQIVMEARSRQDKAIALPARHFNRDVVELPTPPEAPVPEAVSPAAE